MSRDNNSMNRIRRAMIPLIAIACLTVPNHMAHAQETVRAHRHTQVAAQAPYLLLSGSEQMNQRLDAHRRQAIGAVYNLTENYIMWEDDAGQAVQAPGPDVARALIARGKYRQIGTREAAGSAAERSVYMLFSDDASARATVESLGIGNSYSGSLRNMEHRVIETVQSAESKAQSAHRAEKKGGVTGQPDVDNAISSTVEQVKAAPREVLQNVVNNVQYGIQGNISNTQNTTNNTVNNGISKIMHKIPGSRY